MSTNQFSLVIFSICSVVFVIGAFQGTLYGAYYRRPGPYFQRQPADFNMVFLQTAASAKGASCSVNSRQFTASMLQLRLSAEITVCGKGL